MTNYSNNPARGDLVEIARTGAQGFVTALHEDQIDAGVNGYVSVPNGIARVYILDPGASFYRPGTVVDVGTVALSVAGLTVTVARRRDGIAYLTNDGNDSGLRCFSHYGRTTADCAPVAWRLAYLTAREIGQAITTDDLDHAMGLVVNSSDSVAYMVRQYGHGMYR